VLLCVESAARRVSRQAVRVGGCNRASWREKFLFTSDKKSLVCGYPPLPTYSSRWDAHHNHPSLLLPQISKISDALEARLKGRL
jgi:hypothetical protein